MNKLTYAEFYSLLTRLLVDRIFPDFVHIPGLGIRMKAKEFDSMTGDLYRVYIEQGEPGITAFLGKIRTRPDINFAANSTRSLAMARIEEKGITDTKQKQTLITDFYASQAANNES